MSVFKLSFYFSFFIVYFFFTKKQINMLSSLYFFYWFKDDMEKTVMVFRPIFYNFFYKTFLTDFFRQVFFIHFLYQDTYKTMVKFERHIKNVMMKRHFEWITCFLFLRLFLIHLLTHKQNALPEPKKRARQRITKF